MSKITKETIAATDELLHAAGASPTSPPETSKTPLPLERPSTAQATQALAEMNSERFGIYGTTLATMGGQDVDAFLGMEIVETFKPRVLPPMTVETSLAAVLKVDPRWAEVPTKLTKLKEASH